MFEAHQVKVHIFGIPKIYKNCENLDTIEVGYIRSHNFVNLLGSKKCAFLLDVPQTWFNDWPDDDSMGRNMSPHL